MKKSRLLAHLLAVVLSSCDYSNIIVIDATPASDLPSETPALTPDAPTETLEPTGDEYYSPGFAHSLVTLWSTMIVSDGGGIPYGYGSVQEIDMTGKIVWGPLKLSWPHSARLDAASTRLLVSETGKSRVLIFDLNGQTIWNSDVVSPLSDGTVLNYPNEAMWSGDNILITDRDDHRVILISLDGTVIWQHGEKGVAGHDDEHLRGPHAGKLLPNGNLLVCDSDNNRVIEVTRKHKIVWEYFEGLDWPRDATVLSNDHVLMTSSQSGDVVEVSRDGGIVWAVQGVDLPYAAERLPDGQTIVTSRGALTWFDSKGDITKQILPQGD